MEKKEYDYLCDIQKKPIEANSKFTFNYVSVDLNALSRLYYYGYINLYNKDTNAPVTVDFKSIQNEYDLIKAGCTLIKINDKGLSVINIEEKDLNAKRAEKVNNAEYEIEVLKKKVNFTMIVCVLLVIDTIVAWILALVKH